MNTFILRMDSPLFSSLVEEFTYPAGEIQMRLKPNLIKTLAGCQSVAVYAGSLSRTPADIFRLGLLRSALGGPEVRSWSLRARLILPYLPYGRADRRFTDGDCFGLGAFAAAINAQLWAQVITLDAHSLKASQALCGLVDVSPLPLIQRACIDFSGVKHGEERALTVLFPDKGAADRYALPDEFTGNTARLRLTKAYCSKKRDPETGALSGFEVPEIDPALPALIVDDICDGGRTFTGIAEQIHPDVRKGLYVTHGIFSKGTEVLRQHFSRIYTTDSFDGPRNGVTEFQTAGVLMEQVA